MNLARRPVLQACLRPNRFASTGAGSEASDAVQRWLAGAVVGLKLCPFARAVQSQTRIACYTGEGAGGALRFAKEEVDFLLKMPEEQVATTLIVFENALLNFDTFLDIAATLEDWVDDNGNTNSLQVATFHPDYCFGGSAQDAVENYTNRSPYPILHLLRESQVADALAGYPNPENIPVRNIKRMRSLGQVGLQEMWRNFGPRNTGANGVP
jgi:hypothetical protein